MDDSGNPKLSSWMTEQFIADILRKDGEVNVRMVSISPAVPKGENFCSALTRVTVEVSSTKEKISLIVKELPRGKLLRKYLKEAGAFAKEITVYNEILSSKDRCSGGHYLAKLRENLAPACYYASPEESKLVLEDLVPLGFETADRRRGLDHEHCVAAMKALARFHGLSVALGGVADTFRTTDYVEETVDVWRPYVEGPFARLAEVVERCPGYEHFGGKLRRAAGSSTRGMISATRPGDRDVLNHGDFWANNVMFSRPGAGAAVEARLVDFQASRRASPALDLHYFFATSPDMEVRRAGLDPLLREYHAELSDVLASSGRGHHVISHDELLQELKDKDFYSLFVAVSVLGIVLADPEDLPDFEKLSEDSKHVGGDDIMESTYNGERYISMMKFLLPIYEKRGLL